MAAGWPGGVPELCRPAGAPDCPVMMLDASFSEHEAIQVKGIRWKWWTQLCIEDQRTIHRTYIWKQLWPEQQLKWKYPICWCLGLSREGGK